MANIAASTLSNPYYLARCEAAKHNEALSSRESAADIMAMDKGRLYRIESGIITPYPEEVHLMADLYHAPELRNQFCVAECPLGCQYPKAEVRNLDRITVNALSTFRKVEQTKTLLLQIAEDGLITDEEQGDFDIVLKNLEEMEKVSANLRLWVLKNRR